MDDLKRDIATVLCPRFPIGIDGLDFEDGGEKPLPGGFCVFQIDLPDSLKRIGEIRARLGSDFPYLCSDLERGAGHYIRGLTRLPPAMALGATQSEELAFAAGALTGREAKRAGVAVVFAPVLDVADEPRNPIVATRSFSADPHEAARLASAYIRGCQSEGVLATGKHYPGHGATVEDSHLELPVLRRSRAELAQVEEIPFRAAIAANVGAMMIGHLHAVAFDGAASVPTSLSHNTITDGLRRDLGFRGVIFTDALDMGAIYEPKDGSAADEEPAVRSLLAGVDVPLLPRDPSKAARAIRDAVLRGNLPRQRLADAAERIRSMVRNHTPARTPDLTPDPRGPEIAAAVARASITCLGSAPSPALRGDIDLHVIDDGKGSVALPILLERLQAHGVRVRRTDEPTDRSRASWTVVFSDVRSSKGRVLLLPEVAARLSQRLSDREAAGASSRTGILSIGCPQAIHAAVPSGSSVCRLFGYDDDPASLDAAAAAIAGEFVPSGSPVFLRKDQR